MKTLSSFLYKFEGKKPIKPAMRIGYLQQQQQWRITASFMRQQTQQAEGTIIVSPYETMGAVRQRCADYFGLDLNEFHLKVLNKLVDPDEDDDMYVRDHGMSQTIACMHNPLYKKAEHPKFLLAQNREYFDLLFFLLSPQASGSSKLVEPVWELLQ